MKSKTKRQSAKSKVCKILILSIVLISIAQLYKIKTSYGEDINLKYKGIGQKTISTKEGYKTLFKTDGNRTYKEYKQGEGTPWKDNTYWDGTMEENGCGITCLSIIASGYGIDLTPEDLRQKYEPHLEGDKIPNEIRETLKLDCTDFCFGNAFFNKSKVIEHLKKDKPILICVINRPNDKWTEKSHYMVILATDGENKIYVSNPNGYEKKNYSGWYRTEDVLPYIAKALFIEED